MPSPLCATQQLTNVIISTLPVSQTKLFNKKKIFEFPNEFKNLNSSAKNYSLSTKPLNRVNIHADNSTMRRRFAHEWEFLASVLDRVLLITFSFLVIGVTAAMFIVGEIIHFLYDLY